MRQDCVQVVFAMTDSLPGLGDGFIAQHLQRFSAQRHKHVQPVVQAVVPVEVFLRG